MGTKVANGCPLSLLLQKQKKDNVEEEKVADATNFVAELSEINLTCGSILVRPCQETRKKKRVQWFTELCLLIF